MEVLAAWLADCTRAGAWSSPGGGHEVQERRFRGGFHHVTHSGKSYTIDGVQFFLTDAGVAAVSSVLGETFDKAKMIFDANLLPVLQ